MLTRFAASVVGLHCLPGPFRPNTGDKNGMSCMNVSGEVIDYKLI